jgi:hypothetical protein
VHGYRHDFIDLYVVTKEQETLRGSSSVLGRSVPSLGLIPGSTGQECWTEMLEG